MSEKEVTSGLRCDGCGADLTLVGFVVGIDCKLRCLPCHIIHYGERDAS